jgi:hypothetical protein
MMSLALRQHDRMLKTGIPRGKVMKILYGFLVACILGGIFRPISGLGQARAAVAGGAGNRVDTSKWKTYHNAEYGFELKYPETWGLGGEGSGTHWPTAEPEKRTRVWMIEIRKPNRDEEPDARVSVGVQENENPKKLSIDAYAAEQLDPKPESIRDVIIGGQPAVVLETTSTSGTKVSATYTLLHETNLVTLIYYHRELFDPTLAAIVGSFHMVKTR